jgi:membrane protein required for colicin V production
MSPYDIAIIAVVGLFTVWGFFRGFLCELFEVIGIILAIYISKMFAANLALHLYHRIPEVIREPLAAAIISLLVFMIVKILGGVISRILIHGPLKALNKIFGGLVGFVKGCLVVLLALILISLTPKGATLSNTAKRAPVLRWTLTKAQPYIDKYKINPAKPVVVGIPSSSREGRL